MLTILGLILGLIFCCTLIVFAVIGYGRMSGGMKKPRQQPQNQTKEQPPPTTKLSS
jgi:hypothetical protein